MAIAELEDGKFINLFKKTQKETDRGENMGKDNMREFAIINYFARDALGALRIQRLIDRFGADKVEKALRDRENKFRNNRPNPLYDKWEQSRQFA